MDATTKDRTGCSEPAALIAGQDATRGRRAEQMARVAEQAVNAAIPYQAGGRGLNGDGVDGFGFVRMCAMAAAGRDLGDLYGYRGWPQAEPWDRRVANMLDEWGLTQVGDYRLREFRRGDVLVFVGPGPTAEIVVSPANQDLRAVTASCWAPNPPEFLANKAELHRHLVRVYRWVEA